jgi:uncharacterized protein YfdQ (DUF2303 family)
MNDKPNPPNQGTAGSTPFPTHLAIRELIELGDKASAPTVLDLKTEGLGFGLPPTVPVLFNRNTQAATSLRTLIEEQRQLPARRAGVATLQTLQGLTALLKRHQDDDSALFVDLNWRAPKIVAIVDYHRQTMAANPHEPRHLQHRLEYTFPLSEGWQKWVKKNGRPMNQAQFAAFIEDRISDVSAPKDTEQAEYEALFKTKIADPFEIVTLSRGLSVSVSAKVQRDVRLQSGEAEMVFEEVHRDGGNQKLVVPGLFMLSLPVFFRGENVRLPVRLRYRVKEGNVFWFYQMWEPDRFVTDAVERARDAIVVETGVPAYEGAAEGFTLAKPEPIADEDED